LGPAGCSDGSGGVGNDAVTSRNWRVRAWRRQRPLASSPVWVMPCRESRLMPRVTVWGMPYPDVRKRPALMSGYGCFAVIVGWEWRFIHSLEWRFGRPVHARSHGLAAVWGSPALGSCIGQSHGVKPGRTRSGRTICPTFLRGSAPRPVALPRRRVCSCPVSGCRHAVFLRSAGTRWCRPLRGRG
jgi:hypothetical protein